VARSDSFNGVSGSVGSPASFTSTDASAATQHTRYVASEAPRKSYSPFGSKPVAPDTGSSYLEALSSGAVPPLSTRAEAPKTATAQGSDSSFSPNVRKNFSWATKYGEVPDTEYPPSLDTSSREILSETRSDYLNGFASGTVASSASYGRRETPPASQQMGSTVNSDTRQSYAPFGSKPTAPSTGSSYLGALSSGMPSSTTRASTRAATPPTMSHQGPASSRSKPPRNNFSWAFQCAPIPKGP
jgi:hypothetical protein